MQKSQLDSKTKSKILIGSFLVVIAISIPFSLPYFLNGNGLYIGIHTSAIILAAFLSTVGLLTYKEFRTARLFLIMSAFLAIMIAEIAALTIFIFSDAATKSTLDSFITHSLILVMLSFFSVGIFKRD